VGEEGGVRKKPCETSFFYKYDEMAVFSRFENIAQFKDEISHLFLND